MENSSNTIQHSREKELENNEISPFNDIHHLKFIVHSRIINNDKRQLKRKCDEGFQ